jgi:hypothetical protein
MYNYSVMISASTGMTTVNVTANSHEEAERAAISQVAGVVILVAQR